MSSLQVEIGSYQVSLWIKDGNNSCSISYACIEHIRSHDFQGHITEVCGNYVSLEYKWQLDPVSLAADLADLNAIINEYSEESA